jgi:hypothetical protein
LINSNATPRYSLYCGIIVLVRDNLALIVFGSAILAVVGYFTYDMMTGAFNRLTARSIYHKIEDELRDGTFSGVMGYNDGIKESDIIQRYKQSRSDKYFKKNIMPYIENYRKSGKKLTKFIDTKNARDITIWQYKG